MLPFHLIVKKVTILAGGNLQSTHAAKQSALSLEYVGLDHEKSYTGTVERKRERALLPEEGTEI